MVGLPVGYGFGMLKLDYKLAVFVSSRPLRIAGVGTASTARWKSVPGVLFVVDSTGITSP